MTASGNEVEIKIRLNSSAGIPDRLRAAGFRESVPRQFESNTLYDTNDENLRNREMLLRLRQVGDRNVLTWKGPGEQGPHKSRPELETTVGASEAMHRIFEQLGYFPSFRYEKFRTEFSDPGNAAGTLTLDETPIGDFLELEGPGEWIDSTAEKLGFSRSDYVLDSYARLYLADCERRGVQPCHMVFASQTT
jgi:adenylate cyclase, class 2